MVDDIAVGVPVTLGIELIDGTDDGLLDKDGFALVDGLTEAFMVGTGVADGDPDNEGMIEG